jgi:integrase
MATKKADSDTSYGDKIKALKPGQFTTLENRLPGGGALQARKLAEAVKLYWRYTHEGKTAREEIGLWDSKAPPKTLGPTGKGWTIRGALQECERMGQQHALNLTKGGYQAVKEDEARQHQEQKALEADKRTRTLRSLLETYVDYLKARGRGSRAEAANLFDLHVYQPWPKIAAKPAVDVTLDDMQSILGRVVEQGKGRTANKLRAYIRAAYQCAIDSRASYSLPVAFKQFGVQSNPAAVTKREGSFDRANKRPLNANEMRLYWQLLKDSVEPGAAELRLHLLTGAQRPAQFVRLKSADVGDDEITIFDIKGRPGQGPRAHCLPLIKQAQEAVASIPKQGEFFLTTTKGKKAISQTTLSGWAKEIVGDKIPGFQLKRVRSGVETMLSGANVGKDIRGRLQSHGLTNVQDKHYDGHDYMPQKRDALETLVRLLEARPAQVIPMPKQR